ncbi:MAG: hypothetical protein WA431_09800 [Candidatus Cybelea sp.]
MTSSFFNATARAKALIFVADVSHNAVDIYPQAGTNQKMVGQITGLNNPTGLATDTERNVYIANDNTTQVLVYAPPYTGTPKLTLNDGGYYPYGVAVSSLGLVAVTNACNAPSCALGSSSVTFFAKNSSMPCATVADPTNFPYMWFGAFDDRGNLYIDGYNSSHNSIVGEIKGACNGKKITLLTTTNTIGIALGIKVDKTDRIAILDQGGPAIDTYTHPEKGSLGNPISTTPLTGSSDPVSFAFLASGRALYVADGTDDVANEYDYPAGGQIKNTISVGGISADTAATPPLVP